MSGVSLKLELQGIKSFSDIIKTLEHNSNNTSQMMEEIGAYGVASTELRFVNGVAPDGTKWKKSIRVEMNQGGQTLVDRGHLQTSFVSESNANEARWGTNLVYAAINQFGGIIKAINAKVLKFKIPGLGFRSATQVTIPARPFVGINNADIQEIENIIWGNFMRGVQL